MPRPFIYPLLRGSAAGLIVASISVRGAKMKVVPIDDGAVTPFDGGEGKINLSDLNPDLNNDGHVDDWEQQLFDRLQEADSDGSGSVSRLELFGVLKSMLGEVQEAKRAGGEIPIASLNPDTDGDGQVEVWETECYEKIKAADADGEHAAGSRSTLHSLPHTGASHPELRGSSRLTPAGSGNISVKELFEVIKRSSDEVKEAQKGGIPISTLNPDTDGDGKVEKWEVDVFERIKAADEDKSGSINVKELFGVIKGAAESDRQKKLFRKLFIIACVLLVVMLIANMGLTMAPVLGIQPRAIGSGAAITLLSLWSLLSLSSPPPPLTLLLSLFCSLSSHSPAPLSSHDLPLPLLAPLTHHPPSPLTHQPPFPLTLLVPLLSLSPAFA